MVVKVHCGTHCLGNKFATMLKMHPPKQSHSALDNHLDPVSPTTSKWPILSREMVIRMNKMITKMKML